MRKVLTIVPILIFFVAISSCSKTENTGSEELSSLSLQKVADVLKLPNVSLRKLAFGLLSPEEKAEIWSSHLSKCLKNYGLPDNQQALIKEVLPHINGKSFRDKNGYFESRDFEIWKFKVTKAFSKEDLSILFNEVKTIKRKKPGLNNSRLATATLSDEGSEYGDDDPPPTDCGCSSATNNDFCENNGFTIFPCTYVGYRCKDTKCKTSTSGCGWFWSKPCDANCQRYSITTC